MRRRPRRGQEPPADIAPQDRLESWKEIAAYLHRDIRTVQRWELFEGLPIHRHMHLKRGSVYAFREELETWWANRRHDLNGDSKPAEAAAGSSPATSLPPRAERATSDDPEQRARLTATRLENPRRPHRLGQVAIAAMLVGLAGFSIGFVARHNSGAGKPAAAPRLQVVPLKVRDGGEVAEYDGQALAEVNAIKLSRVEGFRV